MKELFEELQILEYQGEPFKIKADKWDKAKKKMGRFSSADYNFDEENKIIYVDATRAAPADDLLSGLTESALNENVKDKDIIEDLLDDIKPMQKKLAKVSRVYGPGFQHVTQSYIDFRNALEVLLDDIMADING